MEAPVVGGALAFLGGAAVSFLNYRINARTLRQNPSALAAVAVVRQLLSVGYLAAVFFLARVLPWDHMPLLLGAAIGLTVPAVLLSMHLAKLNDAQFAKKSDSTEKGEDFHG